jgi:hypothetical protein
LRRGRLDPILVQADPQPPANEPRGKGLEDAAEHNPPLEVTRTLHCGGQRFESPQLHQEVRANRRDFLGHRMARRNLPRSATNPKCWRQNRGFFNKIDVNRTSRITTPKRPMPTDNVAAYVQTT